MVNETLRKPFVPALLKIQRWRFAVITMALLCAWIAAGTGPANPLHIAIAFGLVAVAVAAALVKFSRQAAQPRSIYDKETKAPNLHVQQNLIDALPDPCLLIDRRGIILMHNAEAATFIDGLRTGNPFSFFLRAPVLNNAIEQVLLDGKTRIVDYEEKVPIERWYSAHVAPLRADDNTEFDFIFVSIHDRTDQQRAERMRVDFVANASHELRTPLAAMLGFIETLQGPARDDPVNRDNFLKIMQGQAQRMARLIEDLLSLSRIERNAHIKPETPIDIGPLLSSTIDSLAPLARDRSVTVRLSRPEQPLIILGDRDELIRVFENLIENAIKYGESGKKVDINVTCTEASDADEGAINIAVRDHGPGIAEEHLPRLTERFYRVDVASSREKGGTGLGLAIVKHILNRHGGQIEITSQLGQGSVFTAHLPRAAKSAIYNVASEPPALPNNS